jgi:IgGFc binding protein
MVRSAALSLMGFALAHCSSNKEPVGFGEPGSSGGTSSGASGGVFGDKDAQANDYLCSADLQKVLDKAGNIVKTCKPEDGCAAGQCVPACSAAAASKGSLGCDYQVATPSFYGRIAPPCFAIFLANAWTKPAMVTASRGGMSFDVTKFGRLPVNGQPESAWPAVPAAGIPPGGVAVLFMSGDPQSVNGLTSLACPVPTALPSGSAVIGTGIGQAWHVTTDVPVSTYDILPYGGALSFLPSAELLFPTTAWGNNYFTVVPPTGHRDQFPVWGQIVATEDGTTVDIAPNTTLPAGGGAPAAPAGAVTKLQLKAGEYVQYTLGPDFTGSVISSNKPVSFTGGNEYICYRTATNINGGCDSAHQQIPPIAALGSEYVAAPFKTRRPDGQAESIAYRILGVVDGTTLTFDPPVAGAPATLKAGQSVQFESRAGFVVKTQDAAHPVYIAQMMAGCIFKDGGFFGDDDIGPGDEEFVNVLPPAQFLQRYVFFTDPTYPTTTLTLTRVKTSAGFKDVTIPCLGVVAGWTPVGSTGQYEIATVDLLRAGTATGSCQNGAQSATSDGAFGMTVWGLSNAASYGYPAGGNIAPINAVVVPAIPK